MSEMEHPLKPRSEWCRRKDLMAWKGWSREQIEALVDAGRIKTKRHPVARHARDAKTKHKLGRRFYHVASVSYDRPRKPKTEWCRRRHLMAWKGWSREQIEALVEAKRLKTKRYRVLCHARDAKTKQKFGRRYYHVPSAEHL